MKTQELKVEDLNNWLAETKINYARQIGNGIDKRIDVCLNGNIEVSNNGRVIHKGVQPYQAIEAYNAL